MSISPLKGSMSAFFLGSIILVSLMIPDVLGSEDLDGDGVSDTFQDIHEDSDLVLTSSGDWKEIHIGYSSNMNLPFTAFTALFLLLISPMVTYYLLFEVPVRKENLNRKVSASAMHDNVRRMASFLSTNPSLPKAARLSHVSQEGEGERILGQILWKSRTTGESLEEALLERSRSLDDLALESSLEGLISAQSESSLQEVTRTCNAVVERMGEDIKEKMSSYTSSLRGPSTALFGLGVLLPVLLATMIPIAGFSTRTIVMIGFLMWVVVPFLIIRTGRTLVLRRPIVRTNGSDPSTYHFNYFSLSGPLAGTMVLIAGALHLMDIVDLPLLLEGPFPDTDSTSVLMLLLGSSAVLCSLTSGFMGKKSEKREKILKEEEKVPDLLSEIGTRVMEGKSFEKALERGMERIKDNPTMMGKVPANGGPLRNNLTVAREYSRAGSSIGGSSIKALSGHLGEMLRLQASMKEAVRNSIGQMETTSSIFAPLMIGVSVGIFELMGRSTGSMDGGQMIGASMSQGDMTIAGFILLAGVYLLLLSISTTLTMRRLEEGDPTVGWERVPRNLMLSSITFTAGVAGSTLLLGG